MRDLLRDPDDQVVLSELYNHATPREVLDEARTLPLGPERMEQVAEHWKAVRARVTLAWAESEPGNGITLADGTDRPASS